MEHLTPIPPIEKEIQDVLKRIKLYIDCDSNKIELSPDEIQLIRFSTENEYAYLKWDSKGELKTKKDKYYRLLCYLQGGIRLSQEISPDKSFIKLQKRLGILAGMFCFYDPYEIQNKGRGTPYYLLGPMPQAKYHTPPSLYFRWLTYNDKTKRFIDSDEDWTNWVSFYKYLNAFTRSITSDFEDDYPYFFGEGEHERTQYEKDNNMLYISSGEIDHGILVWLINELSRNEPISFETPVEIALTSIFKDIKKFTSEITEHYSNYRQIANKIYNVDTGVLKFNESTKWSFIDWLKVFGLLNDDFTHTDRLSACIKHFYLSTSFLRRSLNYAFDSAALEKFRYLYEEKLENRRHIDLEILNAYLSAIASFKVDDSINTKGIEHLLRYNVFTHFLQRFVVGCYDRKYLETTCRGLVAFPIQSNKENEAKKNDVPNVGYFYGLIKDSDENGDCYGNHIDNIADLDPNSKVYSFYNERLFQIQHITFNLGRIETQNIYYRGILEKHKKETKKHATRAAISKVMARNMSHNHGSHVLSRMIHSDYVKAITIEDERIRQILTKKIR